MQVTEYQNILIAIDVFAEYEKVLQRGLKVAGNTAKLSLIYVAAPDAYFAPYSIEFSGDLSGQICKQATQKMNQLITDYGIPSDRAVVTVGNTADEIQQYAEQINADLIVIGTHGKSGLQLLLGATANSVLHGVKQDVLAVRV